MGSSNGCSWLNEEHWRASSSIELLNNREHIKTMQRLGYENPTRLDAMVIRLVP